MDIAETNQEFPNIFPFWFVINFLDGGKWVFLRFKWAALTENPLEIEKYWEIHSKFFFWKKKNSSKKCSSVSMKYGIDTSVCTEWILWNENYSYENKFSQWNIT